MTLLTRRKGSYAPEVLQCRAESGRDYLTSIVDLLHRVRTSHPTAGVWEAADFEWWWRTPRPSDEWGQLFWSEGDRTIAAAIATDWGDRVGLDLVTLPGLPPAMRRSVFEGGVAFAASMSAGRLEMTIDDEDVELVSLLSGAGFERLPDKGICAWMPAARRRPIAPLSDGYRLLSRDEIGARRHHFADRSGEQVEVRLHETSLYRPDLDLAVVTDDGEVVAYGLFWHDPATEVGFVEPMRTEEAHQRRGLARHVLTAGLHRLALIGASRPKINYEIGNRASSELYRDVGFVPAMTTSIFVR